MTVSACGSNGWVRIRITGGASPGGAPGIPHPPWRGGPEASSLVCVEVDVVEGGAAARGVAFDNDFHSTADELQILVRQFSPTAGRSSIRSCPGREMHGAFQMFTVFP
jgi:hypothetical protein